MAFLDNSGDIILDAVLTDAGRLRLARGDGSFKITKFALGDDEINYGLYDSTNPSGSAFYDLEIMQSPVLEAFTNNTSNMKSKLITITRTNVLYLPIIEYYSTAGVRFGGDSILAANMVAVIVDKETSEDDRVIADSGHFLNAYNPTLWSSLVFQQGLDTNSIAQETKIPADLYESQYTIEMDNRMVSLASEDGVVQKYSFVDDDSIASYAVDSTMFLHDDAGTTDSASPITGPLGSRLTFRLQASIDLQSSTYLFTTLGSTVVAGAETYYYIDTTIRVSGQTTGYRMDLPIRLLKKQ